MNIEGSILLMSKGQELTETALRHLKQFFQRGQIHETIEVLREA